MPLLHLPTTSITNYLQHSPITPELCRKFGFRAYCVHTVLGDLHCEHGSTNTSKKGIENTGQNFGLRKNAPMGGTFPIQLDLVAHFKF